jgi:FkbM family methyltransferase
MSLPKALRIFSVLRIIFRHPLNEKNKFRALIRFLKWQLDCILNPYPIIFPFTERSYLILKKGMTGATGNLYCGLHDFNEMGFLLHFLRQNDLFIDVGANIGSYTILASAHVGANSITYEPVPLTFKGLLNNLRINNIMDRVSVNNVAVGSDEGEINFTTDRGTMNHVTNNPDDNFISVPISTLDLSIRNLNVPALLKIDVEGYEYEVLMGSNNLLSNSNLKAIIVETNLQGDRYGNSGNALIQLLDKYGFNPFHYNPFLKTLSKLANNEEHNTIYIRDLDFVMDRIKSADKVKILKSVF